MTGFDQPDLLERQEAANKAKKAALERAKAADPALADRLTERMVQAADRKTIKNIPAAEKVENKSREAERTQQAEREPRCKPSALRLKAHSRSASWKPNGKRTVPAVQEESDYQRSVRVRSCIRPVVAWRITSVAMRRYGRWP